MIVLYRGARGRGKTLSMTKDAFNYYKDGYRILSNYDIAFGEFISSDQVLALNKDSDLFNCVLVLDELQIFFDSRNFAKKENKDFSYFIQQIRKRNIIILGTTQYIGTIDLRFRQHIDVVAYPYFDESTNMCMVKYYDLTSLEDSDNLDIKPVSIVYDAKQVFPMFDTMQMLK